MDEAKKLRLALERNPLTRSLVARYGAGVKLGRQWRSGTPDSRSKLEENAS